MDDRPAAQFRKFYNLLVDSHIQFILVGGAAANLHGAPRLTLDVDVLYARNAANLQRLVDCLAPITHICAGRPPGCRSRSIFAPHATD